MYRRNKAEKSRLTSTETLEGETIENKIERIVQNKEPITDGAPEIYTERANGVIEGYNIRTCRWEVAAEAMDLVQKSKKAKKKKKKNQKHPGLLYT